MTRKEAYKVLLQGLEQDHTLFAQFKLRLEQQFTAVIRHDAAALKTSGAAILTLAETLGVRHRERRALVELIAAPGCPESMPDFVARLGGTAGAVMERAWRRLEASILQCQLLNTRNANILMTQFDAWQHLMHGERDTYALK